MGSGLHIPSTINAVSTVFAGLCQWQSAAVHEHYAKHAAGAHTTSFNVLRSGSVSTDLQCKSTCLLTKRSMAETIAAVLGCCCTSQDVQ